MTTLIHKDGQQHGPFTDAELNRLIELGQISLDDLAWREGAADWQPLRAVIAQSPSPLYSPSGTVPVSTRKREIEVPAFNARFWKGAGVALAILAVFGIATKRNRDGANSPKNRQPIPHAPSAKSSVSFTYPNSVEDAKKILTGVWTYVGADAGGSWKKWVLRADGTAEMYSALPNDDNWGEPKRCNWTVSTGRYSDSGLRYYGVEMADAFAVRTSLQLDGTLRYRIGQEIEVPMVKKDYDPFKN